MKIFTDKKTLSSMFLNLIHTKKFIVPCMLSILWTIVNAFLIQKDINWEIIFSGFERAFFLTTCFIYLMPDKTNNVITGGNGFCYMTRDNNLARVS